MHALRLHIAIGIGLALAFLLASPVPAPAAPALFLVVNSVADLPDATPGDSTCATAGGACTLRAAIMTANGITASHTISLPAGIYILQRDGADDTAFNGDLDLTQQVALIGAGADQTIVDGSGLVNDRIFDVRPGGKATLQGITVRRGNQGGINTYGSLTLTHSVVVSNTNPNDGGGISQGGVNSRLLLEYSTVISNSSSGNGGGIYASGYTLTMRYSTVASNTAQAAGGIHFGGFYAALISHSAIHHNASGTNGGGYVHSSGSSVATFINSTVSLNRADGAGGGIHRSSGTVNLLNTTVAYNVADNDADGPGIGGGIGGASTVTARNSLIAGNYNAYFILINVKAYTSDDCDGAAIDSEGYNLIGDSSGCTISGNLNGNLLDVSAKSGALGHHGGGTLSVPLLPGSLAINAAYPLGCTDPLDNLLPTDQRGFPRPVGGRCDIGAYEAPLWLFLPLVRR